MCIHIPKIGYTYRAALSEFRITSMNKRYLSTSDLARLAGVHPNTVRRYAASGLIPPVERSANGYRRFTPHHLDCLRVACLIYRAIHPVRGIRASARPALTSALADDWDSALRQSIAHLAFVQAEVERAEAAASAVEAWQASSLVNTESPHLLIGEAARLLDITIDMLRNWERNGLIAVPRRDGNSYRVYGAAELQRLRVIRALAQAGYSQMAILRMMIQLDKGERVDVRLALDTPRSEDDVYIATDHWLTTLAEQEQVARQLVALVGEIAQRPR